MWNKILLATAIILFLVSAYVFQQAFTSMVKSDGEAALVQTRMQSASSKSKEVATDETHDAYAVLRKDYFDKEKKRLDQETEDLTAESNDLTVQIETVETAYTETQEESKRVKQMLDDMVKQVLEATGTTDSGEGLDGVSAAIIKLGEMVSEVKGNIAREEALIDANNKEHAYRTDIITKERKLNADRNARISEARLDTQIIVSDPNWGYVILDAGVSDGVVIGSRLAVMLGDKKIAELNVTIVEDNRSSADIVHDTLLLGETVQVGDKVVAVRNSK